MLIAVLRTASLIRAVCAARIVSPAAAAIPAVILRRRIAVRSVFTIWILPLRYIRSLTGTVSASVLIHKQLQSSFVGILTQGVSLKKDKERELCSRPLLKHTGETPGYTS